MTCSTLLFCCKIKNTSINQSVNQFWNGANFLKGIIFTLVYYFLLINPGQILHWVHFQTRIYVAVCSKSYLWLIFTHLNICYSVGQIWHGINFHTSIYVHHPSLSSFISFLLANTSSPILISLPFYPFSILRFCSTQDNSYWGHYIREGSFKCFLVHTLKGNATKCSHFILRVFRLETVIMQEEIDV